MELLSPAGSPEAVVAAVQSGADAIYMGFGAHNARRGAKNFTDEEFESSVRYCRTRGCKVYLTLNTLVTDRELPEAVKLAGRAAELGADAILVQDLGLCRVLRAVLPDMPLHASTQMSIHSLAGVLAAADMGITRAVLARELSLEQIRYITSKSPIETEVFVHGAFCFCHSGQCYMSSLIGRRSGNRGMCAQPCRLQYSLGGRMDDYPLSLKDNCLVDYLTELEQAGVACVKIEGRMKRPEYTAIVTGVYSRAVHEKLPPTDAEREQLEAVFSRQGFTQGYFTGEKTDMFGVRTETDKDAGKLFSAARKEYGGNEMRRVPIKFFALIKEGLPSKFAVEDLHGHKAVKEGPVPQTAVNQELTERTVYDQLYKTGGTPYLCRDVSSIIDKGLFLPASVLNEMRRTLLDELSDMRRETVKFRVGRMPDSPANILPLGGMRLIYQVSSAEQLSPELCELAPDYLYVPLEILANSPESVLPFVQKGSVPVAVFPRVVTDNESVEVASLLKKAVDLGVTEALVGNMGQVLFARAAGLKVRGDFGLNVFNSDSLEALNKAGFISATASFELHISQLRDMNKPINTEIISYGRLPLMISDQCIIKNSSGRCDCDGFAQLSDRTGSVFHVAKEYGCRNVVYNAHKLFMADKKEELSGAGLWAQRLLFTIERPEECVRVAERFMELTDYIPNAATRGLYYRGVE